MRPMNCRAVQLYSQLCCQPHPFHGHRNLGDIDCVRKVLLAEGPLSPEDMRFLECLADAVYCPCVLRYKHVAAGTWGQ